MPKDRKPTVTIRLEPELIRRLDNLAPEWKLSRSGLIEFLVEKHLPELEEISTYLLLAPESFDE